MKSGNPADFLVHVRSQVPDQTPESAAHFEGAFSVVLNHLPTVDVVPAFTREPWPPELPDDIDVVRSADEARRLAVALGTYVITPDDARAGTDETIPRAPSAPGGEPWQEVIFYLSQVDFDALVAELGSLAERFGGVHDTVPVSEIASSRLAGLLLARVVPRFNAMDLRAVGR
jgi:hypothetical protein